MARHGVRAVKLFTLEEFYEAARAAHFIVKRTDSAKQVFGNGMLATILDWNGECSIVRESEIASLESQGRYVEEAPLDATRIGRIANAIHSAVNMHSAFASKLIQ